MSQARNNVSTLDQFISSVITISTDTNASDLGYTAITMTEGGMFDVASGKTLNIDVPFQSGLYQCFSGDGYVAFGTGSTSEVYPEWWGAVADYVWGGSATTDCTAAIILAANAASDKGITVKFSRGNYLISGQVRFDNCHVDCADPYYTSLTAKTELVPAVQILGSRKKIRNLSVWFDLPSQATSAVGIQFGGNHHGTASDQFCNSIVENCYVRYAYNSFVSVSVGSTGNIWNNTYINCRSDLAVNWGWYFNAVLGSTTQTWIDCMVDGVVGGSTGSGGWYTYQIDDVAWINCQADDIGVITTTKGCIYVNLASSISIKNFRTEASKVEVNGGRLFYLNGSAEVDNLKIQACTFAPGDTAGYRATIIGLGTTGNSTIGAITLESCAITNGTLYKLDTIGLADGYKCVVTGGNIQRADVRSDSAGTQTIYANKSVRYGTTQVDPVSGTFEIGDEFSTSIINATTIPRVTRVCTTAGTAGTLGVVTATINISTAPRKLTVSTTAGLKEGMFITIVGVTGTKRIVHISEITTVYIDSDANASVTGADVAYSAPVFRIDKQIVAKGTTANRPATLSATDYGVAYMDTTLAANGKPIWWNGTAWVDYAGTSV